MPEATCPGCGAPTEMLRLTRALGDDEYGPAWCWPCIRANVRAARAGVCHCSQIEGEHEHAGVGE